MRDVSTGRGPCSAAQEQVIQLFSRLSQIHTRIGPMPGTCRSMKEQCIGCDRATASEIERVAVQGANYVPCKTMFHCMEQFNQSERKDEKR
jgi:hypothetical protein